MKWMHIILILVGLITLIMIFAQYETNRVAKRIKSLLAEIDRKYEAYVEQQLTYNILKNENVGFDSLRLTHEVMIIIAPEMEAIVAKVNATTYSSITIDYESKFFKNAVMVAESLFGKGMRDSKKKVLPQAEKEFYAAFRTAIESDLTQRTLSLKRQDMV